MSADFTKQLSSIDWVIAPQLTAVLFRGRFRLFGAEHFNATDLYVYAGPAFVGLRERAACELDCEQKFDKASRVAIASTFGFGFPFYLNKWTAIGIEWRALPFARNLAGFDVAGAGDDDASPDNKITSTDRQFRFNHLLTVSYAVYFPIKPRHITFM